MAKVMLTWRAITITAWSIGSKQIVNWTASNFSKSPLHALVLYSRDGGKTIQPLGRDILGTALTVNPDELTSSKNGTIYVQVSDGMNVGLAKVSPVIVPDKTPVVHIMNPKNNSSRYAFFPLNLEGTAYDRQQSLLDDKQFVWFSSIDGMLGTGRNLTPKNLSIGHHKITLTVTDSHGLRGSDTIDLNMIDPMHQKLPTPSQTYPYINYTKQTPSQTYPYINYTKQTPSQTYPYINYTKQPPTKAHHPQIHTKAHHPQIHTKAHRSSKEMVNYCECAIWPWQ
jgi:outer membrane protein assembly factor BamB